MTRAASGYDWIWYPTRLAIYARDGHTCLACGSRERLTLDHVRPVSRGGSNLPRNLITLCLSCNSSRQDRPLSVWKPGLQHVARRHTRRQLDREAARTLARELRPARFG